MFRLLGTPDLDAKPLWQGAFVAAAGFEALKLIVVNILGAVGGSPFAPLAIAITLMVWINYFSRLVMYGASWAMTSELSASALALRAARQLAAEQAAAAGEEAATPVGQKPEAAVTSTGTLAGRFDPAAPSPERRRAWLRSCCSGDRARPRRVRTPISLVGPLRLA